MKTENQVFADFCNCLDVARTDMGIGSEWEVLARNPQNMVHTDGVILVDKISQRRRGFQNERYETDSLGRVHEIWEWIEEYRLQVSVARERRITDTTATATADEVACLLRAWINSSSGARAMRQHGMAPLFVHDVQNQSYRDENDVYQYFSHFDVNVDVVQVRDSVSPHVKAIDLGIRHVPLCPGESGGPVDYHRIWEEEDVSS